MNRIRQPSPAIVVAVLALVAALAGTAIAGPDASTSAITKKKVKQIAAKQINELAPGLSVAHADTAGNATSADTAANADSLQGNPASAFASANSEPYHEIGTPGEPGFQNGWTNGSTGEFSAAGFYKDPLGVVHLKGVISTGGDETTAFTLPPGYRPSQSLIMPAARAGPAAANLEVTSNGQLRPICGGGGTCGGIGIDGLTFRVP